IGKEKYKYDYDSVGNWTRMTTTVAVVENGKLNFEPTEYTYRTIFYYLDEKMARMLEPAPATSNASPVSTGRSEPKTESNNSVSTNSPAGGVEKAKASDNSANKPGNVNRTAAAVMPPPTVLDKSKLTPNQPIAPDTRNGGS